MRPAASRLRFVSAVLLAVLAATQLSAQVNYTGDGYVQNFDGPTGAPNNSRNFPWVDNVTLPGWYASETAYTATAGNLGGSVEAFNDTAVAANTGLFSFGASSATDRALGSRAAPGASVRYGVRLINQTGRTLTRFAVAYTGEQWFKSSAAAPHTLTVEYQLGGSDLQAGLWTAVPALAFTSPVVTPDAAALNGNIAPNRVPLAATVTDVSWDPGQELWLRFSDPDEAGHEHGLAVDDFAFWTGDDGALFLNGANGYVTMGAAPTLGLSVFTLECWFLRTGPGVTTSTGAAGVTAYPLVTKGRGEADGSNLDVNYFLGLDAAGRLTADFEASPAPGITAGQNYPITGVTVATPGVWNHAAVTYDGSAWRLYLNGELDATLVTPPGASPRADSIQHFGIGTAMTSTGASAGFFHGVIDEVRVWHVARSPVEIQATRDQPLTSPMTGLLARYALDEGAGTIVASRIAGAPNGTVNGGPAWALGRRLVPNAPPNVALTSPAADYRGVFPATVSFAATASDPDGAIAKVEFFAGSIKVGEDTTAPYTFDWTQVTAGTYSLIAAATDNSGARITSSPVNITISPNPNRAPTLALASPAAGATGIGSSTTLGVTLADPERAATRVTFYGRKTTPPNPGPDFTIGTLPDTQYYSENIDGRSRHFFAQTQWYVDNRDVLNLAFVSHMGDIVEHGDIDASYGRINRPQWVVADAAMKVIENRVTTLRAYGIPWGAAPGNHDQTPIGNAGGTTNFYNEYFGVSRYAGRSYYGGHYGTNNNNNYQLFSASGLDFIILHLEYDTRALRFYQPVLDWADALLKAHPNRRAIVTSHWIVNTGNPANFSPQGRAIYDALKNNPNLFLMLCGHVSGEGRRSDVFEGRTVHSVLQDYQGRANGGDGWLRTFTFSPARNTISARTYSPSLGRAEIDADSEFTLPYDMQGAVTAWIPLGTVDVPAGGTSTTLDWTGLERNGHYEWYAAVQDEINTTTTGVRRLSTAVSTPPAVELTSPAAGARFPIPATLQLTASARSDTAVARVEFYQGNTKLGEDTTAPYELPWREPVTGDYTLSAIAVDDTGAHTLSRLVKVTVYNPNNQMPAIDLAPPSGGTRLTAPATLALTATASDTDGTIANVEFLNGVKFAETSVAPYSATWSDIPPGHYVLTARATDNDGGVTTSAPLAIEVVPPVVHTLIAANSTWKYLDNGTDQGTAWRAPGFDDSAWPSGAAELGYGEGDESTVVGWGPNPASRAITTYFRRTFSVEDPERIRQLVINLVRDDGAVVYLNGTEVGRSAMIAGATVRYNSLAPFAVEGAAERTFFPLEFTTDPRPLLVRGTNTLAVEVHQQAIANSDLSFNLELLDHQLPVGSPPVVALVPPAPERVLSTLAPIALAATAADPGGAVTRVEFLLNGTRIGESSTAPYTFTWDAPVAGSHVLVARAIDSDGNVISSTALPLAVREADPGRFINLSIRNNVSAGTGTIIVGFVTGGAGTNGNKPLLLRGVGPALAAFGVTNFATDPNASLLSGNTVVASNDNWAGNAQVTSIGAQVGAFPLGAATSRDAAVVVSRPAGPHTFQVAASRGVALAEIYDATPKAGYTPATPRLINVSARALVGSGSDALIAGLVIDGATSRTVLIRAIGPSLAGFGVTNALADPRLELFREGNGAAIAGNVDWGGGAVLVSAFAKVGAFPLAPTSRDAAILTTLAPGAYTVQVTAPAGTTGVALIDIYEVP